MRLTAMFWWIDRWRKSSAYMDMTLEEQGAYRNLLDEAHLRGGPLPNDERILAKACGDAIAWPRIQIAVMARFELRPDGWHNDTLDRILKESVRRAENQANYRNRKDNKSDNGRDNEGHNNPASPSPSPSPSLVSGTGTISELKNKLIRKDVAAIKAPSNGSGGTHARSKHPVFSGERFVVFDWMLEDMIRTLGPHTDKFDLHEWFFSLDAQARTSELVIARAEQWPWLQAALLDEATKRGLPIATVTKTTKTSGNAASLKRFAERSRS